MGTFGIWLTVALSGLGLEQAFACNRFLEYVKDPETPRIVVDELRRHQVGVILVPGIFDRWVNRGAFVDEIKIMREAGVETICTHCRGTGWHSQGSVAANSAAIARLAESLESKGGVILVGHSRGGSDAFQTMLTQEHLNIRGAALMQAPLDGTPVADWFYAFDPVIRNAAYLGLVLTGGHPGMLYELTTEGARAYREKHEEALRRALNRYPVIAYSTNLEPGQRPPLKSALTYPLLLEVAGPNDGMIPEASQSAAFFAPRPGDRDFIRVSERGISHVQIAGHSEISSWALMREILDRMQH